MRTQRMCALGLALACVHWHFKGFTWQCPQSWLLLTAPAYGKGSKCQSENPDTETVTAFDSN